MENEIDPTLAAEQAAERAEERVGSGAATPANGIATTGSRMEVSAQTIARMMGIASATDLQLLEGRLDLLTSRVSTLMMKVDKVLSGLGALASVGDVGRLETQIASLKSMVREAVDSVSALQGGTSAAQKETAESQGRKLREGIRSSTES
jgi:hypothetical protein